MYFFIKLGRHVSHGERIDPIDFGGQRSKVKDTMDIQNVFGNKLVNTIETKPLCFSRHRESFYNLPDIFVLL